MTAPDRDQVEAVLGDHLLDWQWNTLLGILGHLPERPPHDSHEQLQDAITRTCELCGRVGTRRYVQTATGWRCNRVTAKCAGQPKREPEPAAPSDIPAKEIQADVTPERISPPKPTPAGPPITARCQDCNRVWNLTGRVLQMSVDMHEHKKGHIVDILADAATGGDA